MASTSEMSGGTFKAFIGDPLANIALAKGDFAEARRQYMFIYEMDQSQTPEYAYRATLMSIWLGDRSLTKEPNDSFHAYGGTGNVVAARAAHQSAGIAALEGRTAEAMTLFRDALGGFRSITGVWDEALTGITMARLLDQNEPEVAEAIRSTREILTRLKATPLLEQLDAVLAGTPTTKKKARRVEAAAEVQTA